MNLAAIVALAVALLTSSTPLAAQRPVPTLSGSIELDIATGLLKGSFCVRTTPRDTMYFLLHRGLSIHSLRDRTGRALRYRGDLGLNPVTVALRYTVLSNSPVDEICVSYVGAFPVHSDRGREQDYGELIAFNGWTVRATAGTAWFPVLYDPRTDRWDQDVIYEIDVTCKSCKALYITGSPPAVGSRAVFNTKVPRQPLLFAGDFNILQSNGMYFLHGGDPTGTSRGVSQEVADVVAASLARVKRYYENSVGVPFRDTLVLIKHEPVMPMPPGRDWAFISWPAFAFAGYEFTDFVSTRPDGALSPAFNQWSLLAHELAHFYFGTTLVPAGPFRQFYQESFAEFLTLRALKEFAGDAAYNARLQSYLNGVLRDSTVFPLPLVSTVRPVSGETFRYRYGPLLLVALEQRIGVQAMNQVLRMLLTTRYAEGPTLSDLGAAVTISASEEAWRTFHQECLTPKPGLGCLATISRSP